MFDLRLLNTFVTVAQLRHFGRAAEVLHATQPGVSQHVNRLEEQLGFPLLKRSKRSVELTLAGEAFMRHAIRLISMAKRMEEEARMVAQGLSGQLSLGLSSSIVYTDMPRRIAQFKDSSPDLQVTLDVRSGDNLQALLDAYTLDAAVTTLPLQGSEYFSTVIARQAMGVALPATHPLAKRKKLSVRSLGDERFIVVPREKHPEAHDALVSILRAYGHSAKLEAHEVSFPNVITRVAVGEGVALVPMGYAGMAPDTVHLVRVTDAPLAEINIFLVARRDRELPVMPRLVQALANK